MGYERKLKGVHKLTEACGVSTAPCPFALVILSSSEESKLAVD